MLETRGQRLTDDELRYLKMYMDTPMGKTLIPPSSISYERLIDLHLNHMDNLKGENMGSHYEAIHGYRDERHERPTDKQIGGDHYIKHSIQPIDVIREYSMDFFEGNALKYLLRYKEKNGIEDLLKCKDYIDMIIDNINTKESK